MQITIFHPYGAWEPTFPFLWLFAKYLRECGHKMEVLSCGGCFELCSRRSQKGANGVLGAVECFRCMKEQSDLYDGEEVNVAFLGEIGSLEESSKAYRWAATVDLNSSSTMVFEGVDVAPYFRRFAKSRTALGYRNPIPEKVEGYGRAFLASIAKLILEAKVYFQTRNVDLAFVSGRDFFCEIFKDVASLSKIHVATFTEDPKDKMLYLSQNFSGKRLLLDFSKVNLSQFMDTANNWPSEVTTPMKEMMSFLKIPSSQLVLFAVNR